MKVARGRSWQPEIGMEHASRGRRSGNKGVGARWRGRFRIFSARHCSRTKVSHAENSGMTMLFARRRICGCAVAKRLHGRDIVAALLGLFWRLLREGRLKVARGRSWQPEIGMEHASRGRRSGNKGVGARLRGRFRIFSARHCSRTKVSHAENSGMTMLFFCLAVAPVSEGDSFTPSGEDGTRGLVFFFGGCSGVGGGFFHTLRRGRHEGVSFPGYVPPQERTARGG